MGKREHERDLLFGKHDESLRGCGVIGGQGGTPDITTIFENGVALTNSVSTVAPSNSPSIWLGRFQPVPSGNLNTLQLFGGIDDVRMYNHALSAAEVQQLYVFESGPRVDLIKAVKPSFSNLSLGTNYQVQVSLDMNTWTNSGSVFAATNSSMVYPQYFDVDNWNQLFFRLQVGQ